jgi:hypothetical protein
LKTYFLLFFSFSVISLVSAQETHNNAWFRLTINAYSKNNIVADVELNHRRQNDFNKNNPFDKNLIIAIRPWFYLTKKENFAIIFSPIAYFSNYKIIQKASDSGISSNEYRITFGEEYQNKLTKNVSISSRALLEYRLYETVPNGLRFRTRIGAKYDFNKNINTTIGNEIFLNTINIPSNKYIFDHNRVFINLSLQGVKKLKIDVGYIYANKLPRNAIDHINENNFYLNFKI